MIYTALDKANEKIKALEEQLAQRDKIIKNLSSECSSLAGQLDERKEKEGQDDMV